MTAIAPSKAWRESISPDEAAEFEAHGAALRALQRRRAKGGKATRALHAKGFGVVGELDVLPDLSAELRQGLFAEPRGYRCYVRFSNGAGAIQSDKKPDVRAIALKVLGVDGKKIIPGMQDATTQDLLFIRTPSIPFRDAKEFVGVVLAAANPLLALPRILGLLGLSRGLGVIRDTVRSLGAPYPSVATSDYFTAVPIKYGDYAAKLSLSPRARPSGDAVATSGSLEQELAGRLSAAAVVFDVFVQLYRDDVTTPIEDPTIEWTEAAAPREKVATLTLPVQDMMAARGREIAARVDALSFDPWHALEAHRPLGNIMRARNVAYRHSTEERAAAAEPEAGELDRVANASAT